MGRGGGRGRGDGRRRGRRRARPRSRSDGRLPRGQRRRRRAGGRRGGAARRRAAARPPPARRGGRGRARARRRRRLGARRAPRTRACRASSTTGCTSSPARCGWAAIGLLGLLWWPAVRRTSRGSRVAIAREVLAPFGRVADGRVPRRGLDRAGLAHHPARPRRRAVGHRLRPAAGGQDRRRRADRGGELRPREAAAAAAARRRGGRRGRAATLDAVAQRAVARARGSSPRSPRSSRSRSRRASSTRPGQAQAAVCDPCPLPRPAADELGVADAAGSSVVAGLDPAHAGCRHRDRCGCSTARAGPRACRSSCPGARTSSCGEGCRRFRLPAAATSVEVAVRERGRRYAATLPARPGTRRQRPPRARPAPRARSATMRALARGARAGAADERPGHGRHDRVPAARARPPRVAHRARRAERRDRPPPVDPPARPRLARGALRLRARVQDPLVVRLEPLRARGAPARRARDEGGRASPSWR